MNKIFVVDGNFYLWRCWYTLRTSRPIEDVLPHNFVSLILKDACAIKATHILVCFDGAEVFRYKIFPEYKANRRDTGVKEDSSDEGGKEIYSYLPAVRSYLEMSGLAWVQNATHEADDLLASAASQYDGKIILGSRDKDGYQSLNEFVSAYDSTQETPVYITKEKVEKKMGIRCSDMIMYQTLIGDKIDNIPCLKTPAVAKKLIKAHGDFKTWFANATAEEKIWLRANQVKLTLNKQLVAMRTDLLLPDVNTLKMPKLDRKEMPKSWYAYKDWLYPKTKGLFKSTY